MKSAGVVHNSSDFASRIHKNRSYLSECMSGRRPVTEFLARDIVAVFPEVNKAWLLDESCSDIFKPGASVFRVEGEHRINDRDFLELVQRTPGKEYTYQVKDGAAEWMEAMAKVHEMQEFMVSQRDLLKNLEKQKELLATIQKQQAQIDRLLGIIEKMQG